VRAAEFERSGGRQGLDRDEAAGGARSGAGRATAAPGRCGLKRDAREVAEGRLDEHHSHEGEGKGEADGGHVKRHKLEAAQADLERKGEDEENPREKRGLSR